MNQHSARMFLIVTLLVFSSASRSEPNDLNQVDSILDRLENLLDPTDNLIFNMSVEEAIERVGSGDAQQVRQIEGQFALLHKRGNIVRMARSIGRPMRYFLAKRQEGPALVVADRIGCKTRHVIEFGIDGQYLPQQRVRRVGRSHARHIAAWGKNRKPLCSSFRLLNPCPGKSQQSAQFPRVAHRTLERSLPAIFRCRQAGLETRR